MALSTAEDVQSVLPEGTRINSAYRTPEHNAAVGGVANSFHTRGSPNDPRAFDLTPPPGMSMAQLRTHLANSGVPLSENINEGDHVHVGFDGKPLSDTGGGDVNASYRVVNSQDLAPEDTPESLQAQGYSFDPERNVWFRNVGQAPIPAPLDDSYARRQEQREGLALDQEQADLMSAVQAGVGISDQAAGAVLADVGKGVFLEGGQAAISGLKRGINEIGELAAAFNAATIDRIPGEQKAENFIMDNAFRVGRMVRNLFGAGDTRTAEQFRNEQAGLPTNEGERPTTVTGSMIEGVTQFTAGMLVGGEVLKPIQAITKAGRVGKALAQGAIADFSAFDGNQARLSNLLAEHSPAAIAPMFEYLAANEDDPEMLGRFKSAVEGAGLGVATELLAGGLRSIRNARRVREEIRSSAAAEGLQIDPTLDAAEATARGEEVATQVRQALGNPEGPRFRVKVDQSEAAVRSQPADMAGEVADAAPTANVFDINLARIETPEDVQAVITGMADRFAKDVDLARRGQRSWDATREAAGRLDWVSSMAQRRVGDAVNAETALAYREAVNASATKVLELARAVRDEPTVANQYAFRRATAAHHAIQNELMGARAEAGRALNAFRIPAGTPANSLRQIDNILADAGGANSAQALADRVLEAAKKGDVALNEMIRGGALARTRDLIQLVYTNGLLSGVGTPIINTVGNAAMLGLNVTARAVSPRLARAFGGQASTQIGEATAILHGYQQAMRDVFRLNPFDAARQIGENGGEALRRDGLFRGMAPGLDDAAPEGMRLRAEREEAGMRGSRPLSAAAWRVDEDTPLGRFLDIAQMLVEAPSNINSMTDDFFKVVAARGELHAQAFRQVIREGVEGEAGRARMAEMLNNPTDDMLAAAEREMHDLTFTRQTPGIAENLAGLRRSMDSGTPIPFGTMFLPFVRTPANLVSMGLQYSPLAPFSRRFRDALAEGGAAAETAKAKIAVGTAMWSVWMGMAMDGQITGAGPGNRGQREALMRTDEFGGSVFQPYSVRFGDRWYSFERADPLGQGLALIGDMADLMKNTDWDDDQRTTFDQIATHAVMALGQAFFDKTTLQGATEITSALLDGTEAKAEKMLQRRLSSMIPMSSGLRMLRRGEDPYLRETHGFVDAFRNTVPGLSDELPPQRDLWGRPRTYQTGLGTVYDAMVPVQTRAAGGSAIDLEVLNNGVSAPMPARSISVMGETVSLRSRPDIYSELVRESGEPAFAKLTAVVTGQDEDSDFYLSLPEGVNNANDETYTRGDYIADTIRAYRADARAVILERYAADLQQMAADRTRRREQARAPE